MLTMTEEELDLEAGDRLVLYTDGLTDALALDGGRFDRVRLKALLQTAAGQGTDALCAAVFSVLGRYQAGAEQYDDMTLLVMGVEA
ncbi:MAG: serine/threonine-protein phosphatase [Anaerolineae bacterium]|nr:serine/threonine-protein phosphatase [Anaerolineae bacterium]